MRIEELLQAPKLWTAVRAVFDSARRESRWDSNASLAERIDRDVRFSEKLRMRLRRIFANQVVDKMLRPAPVTVEELTGIAIGQLAGVPTQEGNRDFVVAKARFVAFVAAIINADSESEIDFDLGYWGSEGESRDSIALEPIWEQPDPNYFTLCASADRKEGVYQAKASLVADCSEGAMALAERELRPVVESVAKTAILSRVKQDGRVIGNILFGPVPTLQYLQLGDGGRIIRSSLSAYLGEHQEKDDVFVHLKVATGCLADADKQTSPDVALVKAFAAIEEMVCKESDDKQKTISTHVPTLLQRNPRRRADKGEVLRELYGLRSKAAHARVDVDPRSIDAVRRCAAGVVRALIRWRFFQVAAGEVTGTADTTWGRFQKDISYAQQNGTDVTQVDIDLYELLPESVCPDPDMSWLLGDIDPGLLS